MGVTGGIGSGKSAAARRFQDKGICVVDTDVIAHELTAPYGAAIGAIRARFGAAMITSAGALDRAAMRAAVFANPEDRRALEQILHPLIGERVRATLQHARGPYAIVVVPLLIETGGYANLCNRVLVVDCSEHTQITRTMARSQLSEAQVRAIMAAQATRAQRVAHADDLINNDGSLEDLHIQVDKLHDMYCDLGRRMATSANAV